MYIGWCCVGEGGMCVNKCGHNLRRSRCVHHMALHRRSVCVCPSRCMSPGATPCRAAQPAATAVSTHFPPPLSSLTLPCSSSTSASTRCAAISPRVKEPADAHSRREATSIPPRYTGGRGPLAGPSLYRRRTSCAMCVWGGPCTVGGDDLAAPWYKLRDRPAWR